MDIQPVESAGLVEDAGAALSIGSANAAEADETNAGEAHGNAPRETAAALGRKSPDVLPRLQTANSVAPIDAGDPRWAQDVEPVEDGFEWQGRLALSADGDDIVTLNNRRTGTNPLIRRSGEPSELAYAAPERRPIREAAAEPAVEFSAEDLVDARTKSAVNMRSAGKKGASVITVVPGGAAVRVTQDCQHWCETVYQDKRGYVYKSYLTLVDMGSTASIRAERTPEQEEPAASDKPEMRAEDYMQWQRQR